MLKVTKLKRSEDKFVLLFENSPVGMAMIDHHSGAFLEVNDALLGYVGYSRNEFMKMSFWDITPREYDSQEHSQIKELNECGRFGPNEKEYIRKDGSKIPIRLSGFKMTDVCGRDVVWGVIEDISTERELEEERKKLKHLANTDHLTGLYNRQKLEKTLRFEMSRESSSLNTLSVIMIDMDHFKTINDTLGHQAGDKVLVAVSTLLRECARNIDVVGRWGGEEFLIICPDISQKKLESLAEQIREGIENLEVCDDRVITASFGLAQYEDGNDINAVITRADNALYRAKKNGRNRVVLIKQ